MYPVISFMAFLKRLHSDGAGQWLPGVRGGCGFRGAPEGTFGVAGLFFVSVVAVRCLSLLHNSLSVKIHRPTHQKGSVTIG